MNESTLYALQQGLNNSVKQNNIQLGGVKGQNQNVIFGDRRQGYINLDYINKRIQIANQYGTVINTMDQNGITITDGAITIKNENSESVLNATGLVSTTNFTYAQVFNGAASQTTSSTSYVDVTGGALTSLVVSSTAVNAIFFIMAQGYNDGNITSQGADYMQLQLYDSFITSGVINVNNPGSGTTYTSGATTYYTMNDLQVSREGLVTVDQGTHDYKLQMRAVNGGNATLHAFLVGYMILGAK